MSLKRLYSELKEINKEPNYFYSINADKNNFYKWNVIMIGPPDTPFEGAILNALLEFPIEYPNKPPQFKFITPLFHPNVYTDGKVCISILHEGIDVTGYENIADRWNPSHSVNSILMSILSILFAPNFESSANIDATKMWKNNYNEYKNIVYKMVSLSQ